jgi:uncharacterized protein (DUF2141 family)
MVGFFAVNRVTVVWTTMIFMVFFGGSVTAFAATLSVTVDGVRDAQGTVAIAVYSGVEGFPKDSSKAIRRVMAPINETSHSASAVFPDLPADTYAIAVFHDDNNSGKLETNFFGVPTKGYGFSNDPNPNMRAARYEESSFVLSAAGSSVRIRLHY